MATLAVCKGCLAEFHMRSGSNLYCPDCAAYHRDRRSADALDQGHGELISLGGLNQDEMVVAFVLSIRGILDRGLSEGEAAVGVALRDGAAGVSTPGEPCFAREIDALLGAADRAAEGLDELERYQLLAGCDDRALAGILPRGARGPRTVTPVPPARARRDAGERAPRGRGRNGTAPRPLPRERREMFEIREKDWIIAEAESLAAAEACAVALLTPGKLPDGGLYGEHSGLDIYAPLRPGQTANDWVENGRVNEHGEVVWKSNDLRRQHERTVVR